MVGPEAAALLAQSQVGREMENERLKSLFRAIVRMKSGDLEAEWEARAVGLREDVNESTRAFVLRVAVDDPVEKAVPGVRPMLLRGTFCSVELRGETVRDALVVPRSALRNGALHVVGADGRLSTRDVQVRFEQGDCAVIQTGLSAGDRVVVSDTGSAFDGARVDALEDEELVAFLRRQATGEEPLR